jgi:hypothetical protein
MTWNHNICTGAQLNKYGLEDLKSQDNICIPIIILTKKYYFLQSKLIIADLDKMLAKSLGHSPHSWRRVITKSKATPLTIAPLAGRLQLATTSKATTRPLPSQLETYDYQVHN